MSTYYNYVRRGTESQVDWGKIGKGLSDEITRISQDREAKRTELDKLNTDLIRSASQVTAPEQEYVRNLVLNGTNEMKNLALTNNNLLKRGIITPAQYRMVMENMSAGVSDLDKASKEFDSSYKKSMERLAKGEMGFREQKLKENLFKYGNLRDKTLYVAPDGAMYITSIDENGNPVADPKKMMNTGVLAQGLGQEITSFDLNSNLEKGVNSIGSVVEVLRKNGIMTTESQMNNPKYKEARDLYIDSIMGDPNNVVDILGDFLGREDIAQDVNGNFIPTEQQTKEVREKITSMFDAMVTKKATPMPVFAPTGGGGGTPNKEDQVGKNLRFLISGTGPESTAAAQFFASQNPNIKSIVREDGLMKISFEDGGYQEFNQNDTGTNADLIARGMVGFLMPSGISNVEKVLRAGGITPTLSMASTPIGYKRQQQFKPLTEISYLSPDGSTLVTAATDLNSIDPDGDIENQEKIQSILNNIDPRLTVSTQNNYTSKDKLTLYIDGNVVGTIDYDDAKDKGELIKLIEKARTPSNQQTQTGTTPGGPVNYSDL